jgi:hypothetical protein
MTPERKAAQKAAQVEAIAEAPSAYRKILKRAYGGNSKASGIKAFCLSCLDFKRGDIRECTAYACVLHPYRPYQGDTDQDD